MAAGDLDLGPLSCSVCFEKFDLREHRPKILNCGHTSCQSCVEKTVGRLCSQCRKPFTEAALLDNFQLCHFLENDPPTSSRPTPLLQRSMFWCRNCRTLGTDICLDEHQVCSLVKLKAECSKSAADAQKAVDALEGLSSQAQTSLESWRETLQRLQRAEEALVTQGDLEARLAATQQDLSRDGAWILEAADQCRATLELEDQSASLDAPPELEILCYKDLKRRDPASLQDPRLYKVTSLRYVPCDDHPDWSEALLQKVAGRLQRLHVDYPQPQHLAAIQGMSRLRALLLVQRGAPSAAPPLPRSLEQVWVQDPSSSQLLDLHGMPRLHSLYVWSYSYPLPSVSFPPLPQGQGLRLLMVEAHPASSCLPLVRAHAATLQDLWVRCAEDPRSDEHIPDLGRELSGLTALRRLVLRRWSGHNMRQCGEEKWRVSAALRRPAEVLCKECDNLSEPDLWKLQ